MIVVRSYIEKAEKFLKSSQLLLDNAYLESSVSDAYYAMYYIVTAILYRCRIKCENHTVSIILIQELFGLTDAFRILNDAKELRINSQYYTDYDLNKEVVQKCIDNAKEVFLNLSTEIDSLNDEKISSINNKLDRIVGIDK